MVVLTSKSVNKILFCCVFVLTLIPLLTSGIGCAKHGRPPKSTVYTLQGDLGKKPSDSATQKAQDNKTTAPENTNNPSQTSR